MLDGAGRVPDDASTSRTLARAGNKRKQDYKRMVLDNVGCWIVLGAGWCRTGAR